MATTLQKISSMLDEKELKYTVKDDRQIVFGLGTKTYRDKDDENMLLLVIALSENGEYLQIFAPQAYKARGTHKGALLEACMQAQWETKLIQFEFDPEDGEIRPVVEFPLEDAELTSKQLYRCIGGIIQIMDTYHPTFVKAIQTGVIEMPDASSDGRASSVMQGMMATMMLQSLLAEGRSENDPLVQQLRTLIAGESAKKASAPDSF